MKRNLSIFFILLISNLVLGQTILRNAEEVAKYDKIPQETIFVHANTSFLFAGEYLYYKVYNLNTENKQYSDFSKIAYIELISEDKTAIFKHKIRLDKGVGQGDFFIPVATLSGNYKLIAYTQWMKNAGKNHFFQSDVSILNPYQGNQRSIREDVVGTDSLKIQNKKLNNTFSKRFIELKTDKEKYTPRSQVTIKIKNIEPTVISGDYSLSIRKTDTIEVPKRITSVSFLKEPNTIVTSIVKKINDKVVLPEIRGELVSGKVIMKETGEPAVNKNIAISIYGQEYEVKTAHTNEKGIFYLNLNNEYDNGSAVFQVLDDEHEKYKLIVNEHESVDYSSLKFNRFKITPQMEAMILERSVYNQIENGYFTVKPDTVRSIKTSFPFFGNRIINYNLDDYTRFQGLKETIVEVVENVSNKRDKNGDFFFLVKRDDGGPVFSEPSLLLVDGLIVQNHNEMIDYDARNIQSIKVIRDEFVFGAKTFQGVVAIETLNGDYNKFPEGEYAIVKELFKPQLKKSYFKQVYRPSTASITDRIPDFRNQLLWIPKLKLSNEELTIPFFTSDNIGVYDIIIEGFTTKGQAVSETVRFEIIN